MVNDILVCTREDVRRGYSRVMTRRRGNIVAIVEHDPAAMKRMRQINLIQRSEMGICDHFYESSTILIHSIVQKYAQIYLLRLYSS